MNFLVKFLCEFYVAREVILVEWILDRNNRVLVYKIRVQLDKRVWCDYSIISTSFLRKIVHVCFSIVKFRGSNIEANIDSTSMTTVLDSLHNDLESVVFISKLGGTKATFVTNVCT